MNATQNGVPIIECGRCGMKHPETRRHCPVCGKPSLFQLIHCMRPIEDLEDVA